MSHSRLMASLAAIALCQAGCVGPVPAGVPQAPGLFAERWRSGASPAEPSWQTQAIDGRTFAIRQSIRTTFEAPFVYLVIGRDRALLIDTGVAGAALRSEVDRLLERRRAGDGRSLPLVVMHTHGHSDHVGGDADFKDRPATQIVKHGRQDVVDFFWHKRLAPEVRPL